MKTQRQNPARIALAGFAVVGMTLLATVSCKSPHEVARRAETNLDPGFPRGNNFFHQVSYQVVSGGVPTVEGAEYVNDDELCQQCHPAYAKTFAANNVHRGDSCEGCHGPGSRHLEARGKEAISN